ncbi:hypothetical protein [Spongiactinospora sp. TRM90649]|uniref:hypothetical protein n=1 Tax=Spongiactinospora sp. TRM90649 TaxID=3031114 RepID=UPI0023F913B4|nr:hypothetical protein [Spongiactinospora sp. TRM90649]MDF5759121.1 hypothetical protein [Spongiactinospora sp. TRM90649]
MKHPIVWPGPSRPAHSVADPIRLGLWQDLDEIEYTIVGHHLQIMGKTGAGKSIGGAWNYLAEVVSRADVAVFAADITKGEQTLGPLREALHRFETTKDGTRKMLSELHAQVNPRTDHLAAKGLATWKPGCGLTYWLVWLEEFPDIFDALPDKEQEAFLSMLKAIRSAGGTIVMSLQRSDYTQMPTLARGQLAKMCFGVDNTQDASFGLSEAQQDAGARPELWASKQPGMAYLDAPSIPDGRIALPLRTYAWGIDTAGNFDDRQASQAMRAHAAAHPAAAKTVDTTTAWLSRLTGGPGALGAPAAPAALDAPRHDRPDNATGHDHRDESEEDMQNVTGEYLSTDDPDPGVRAGIDDEIPDIDDGGPPPITFTGPPRQMTNEERGAVLMARLHQIYDAGGREVGTGDFKDLWESTDISRAWFQKQMKRLSAAGIIGPYDDDRQRYPLPQRPAA